MNFVVIGTDHRMQHSESGLEAMVQSFLQQPYIEPLHGIAEEYSEDIGESIAKRIVKERAGLCWYNVDMTNEDKEAAGILQEQRSRPASKDGVVFRLPSDEVREDAWVEKLLNSGSGTVLVVCGYLHSQSLAGKLRDKGCAVDHRVYLEAVPQIKLLEP